MKKEKESPAFSLHEDYFVWGEQHLYSEIHQLQLCDSDTSLFSNRYVSFTCYNEKYNVILQLDTEDSKDFEASRDVIMQAYLKISSLTSDHRYNLLTTKLNEVGYIAIGHGYLYADGSVSADLNIEPKVNLKIASEKGSFKRDFSKDTRSPPSYRISDTGKTRQYEGLLGMFVNSSARLVELGSDHYDGDLMERLFQYVMESTP